MVKVSQMNNKIKVSQEVIDRMAKQYAVQEYGCSPDELDDNHQAAASGDELDKFITMDDFKAGAEAIIKYLNQNEQ